MNVRLLAAALLLMLAVPAYAAQQQQQQTPPQQEQDQDEVPTFEEQVVVSASRTEQQLVNAPATVSLVTSETIQNSPATNIGDLLRAVPGVNVTQVSARDINITSRGATSTLSTSQLALVDGRSVYLDFFGMVMWDLVPANPNDIRQIEVIRGPASAVWGANAMTGVINVITKSAARAGGTGRHVADDRPGDLRSRYVRGGRTECRVALLRERLARRGGERSLGVQAVGRLLHAGSDAAAGRQHPERASIRRTRRTSNEGTSQPKFDGRVDYDVAGGGTVTVAGGVAGTEGIIHSGIGPFDIASDSRLSYVTTRYVRGGRRIAFFTNLLDGNAANLLARGVNGQPLPLDFKTKTFDFEATDVKPIGTRHVLSYGGNFRHNTFDISIAPNGDNRNEGGALHPGRDLPRRSLPLGDRRPRRQVLVDRRCRLLAADDAPGQAGRRPDVPRLVQPRLPRAVVHQQQHRHDDPERGGPQAVEPGARHLRLPDPRRRQWGGSEAGNDDGLRGRVHGRDPEPRDGHRRPSTGTIPRTASTSRRWGPTDRRIPRPAGHCRRRSLASLRCVSRRWSCRRTSPT